MIFKKKEKTNDTAVRDLEVLRRTMDNVIAGDYNAVVPEEFSDQSIADQLNELIHSFKKSNNKFVMKLNEAMTEIGDTSYVKSMIDQVNQQTASIGKMEESSRNLESSIEHISNSVSHIKDNAYEVLRSSEKSEVNMNDSISVVTKSSEDIGRINQQVQTFRAKIDKISEIIDMVKKIASQSNLLALNASIEAARAGEAGKGFAVVADQVRQLASNTSTSAEDISRTVTELQLNINELATAMDDTTKRLSEGNQKLEMSVNDIQMINAQINTISDEIDSIYRAVDTQSAVTREFGNQTEKLSKSYQELSQDCNETGNHMFKSSRHADKVRTDLYKENTEVTVIDSLKIFDVDHFLLTWRVYNHIVGFEKLKISQLNNPDTCKLGKWLGMQNDPKIVNTSEFKNVVAIHKELHSCATNAWNANEKGDKDHAIGYFNTMLATYQKLQGAINRLQELLRSIGLGDETEIIKTVM